MINIIIAFLAGIGVASFFGRKLLTNKPDNLALLENRIKEIDRRQKLIKRVEELEAEIPDKKTVTFKAKI
jgi:hypothetical protein